jgi:hypothetical protein
VCVTEQTVVGSSPSNAEGLGVRHRSGVAMQAEMILVESTLYMGVQVVAPQGKGVKWQQVDFVVLLLHVIVSSSRLHNRHHKQPASNCPV